MQKITTSKTSFTVKYNSFQISLCKMPKNLNERRVFCLPNIQPQQTPHQLIFVCFQVPKCFCPCPRHSTLLPELGIMSSKMIHSLGKCFVLWIRVIWLLEPYPHLHPGPRTLLYSPAKHEQCMSLYLWLSVYDEQCTSS